ncbi:MAG: hypothetical protein GC168_17450 [Candidatus Hydrogenedens sp.]|nr:hypothetical protein [Candidatus Hydrogenedens sp.]
MPIRVNYRKLAYETYPPICAYCGFGVPEVLEVAHLNGDRSCNDIENLAILCPNCHKMHDIGMIPTAVVVEMRDRERTIDWSIRMKDAGKKAAQTRKRKAAAKRAWNTRRGSEASGSDTAE